MRKKIKLSIVLILVLLIGSCSKDDKIIDDTFDGITNGAILRIIDVVSGDMALGDSAARFEVVLEEQDNQNGDLFKQIDVYTSFQGGTKTFVKTIDASTFTIFQDTGLPRGTVMATIDELSTAVGINPSSLTGGEAFSIELDLVLTDGRIFNADNTGANVSGGAFYNSPFKFSSTITCLVDASLFVGDYEITQDTNNVPTANNATTFGPIGTVITLEVGNSGTQRIATNLTYVPEFALGQNGLTQLNLNFVCGNVNMESTIMGGVVCTQGTPIEFTQGTSAAYDLSDDTTITIVYTEDTQGSCGGPHADSVLVLTKV